MMKKNFILIGVVMCLLSCFLGIPRTMARIEKIEGLAVRDDFKVRPAQVNAEAYPGDTIKQEVQIDNRLGKEQDFLITVEDFQSLTKYSNPDADSKNRELEKYNATDWVKSELNRFRIAQGERQFFDIEIAVPEDAEVGEYYASVFVAISPVDSQKDLDTRIPITKITDRIGIAIRIKVKGFTKKEGLLSSFQVDKQWYQRTDFRAWRTEYPINFLVKFKNSGMERLRPYGSIRVVNMFNKEVAVIPVEPFSVLRNSEREMSYNWQKKWFLGGYYKATLKLYRGDDDGQNLDVARTSFWIIPWKEMCVALGLFVVMRKIKSIFSRNKKRVFPFKRKNKYYNPAPILPISHTGYQPGKQTISKKRSDLDMRVKRRKIV